MSLKINNLTIYGNKSLNLPETKCGICMEYLYDSCNQCQNEKTPTENKEVSEQKNKEDDIVEITDFCTDIKIIKFFDKTIDNRQSFFCFKEDKEDKYKEININNNCFGVIGICNHAYHHCCIGKSLKGKPSWLQLCPLCNNKWDMKKILDKFK